MHEFSWFKHQGRGISRGFDIFNRLRHQESNSAATMKTLTLFLFYLDGNGI